MGDEMSNIIFMSLHLATMLTIASVKIKKIKRGADRFWGITVKIGVCTIFEPVELSIRQEILAEV